MKSFEQSADLVLVVGTSLSGLNADKIVASVAKRSCQGKSLGSVIVNLQQTQCDGGATLRIFSECDKLFEKLLSHLNLTLDTRGLNPSVPDNKILVPYDKHGRKTDGQLMWLDLSKVSYFLNTFDHENILPGSEGSSPPQPQLPGLSPTTLQSYRGF